jgi:hypothetical protein
MKDDDTISAKTNLARTLKQVSDSVKAHPPDLISCTVEKSNKKSGRKEWLIRVVLHPTSGKDK